MSFTVAFYKSGALLYAFPTPTPFPSPKCEPGYNSAEPPALTSVLKTWDITGIFYGKEPVAVAKWTTLISTLTDPTNQADEIRLIQGASTIVDRIGVSQGFAGFKIDGFESPKSDLQFRSEMRFRVRVSGRLVFALVGIGTDVVDLEQRETWSYSPEGLLTHTLTGKVTTKPGTSATAQAQVFGLTLPSGAFAYSTNGPGGVDVERLNEGDTEASFTSTVEQSATVLPAGVAADYSFGVTVSEANGETTRVVSVSARGVGAASAVAAAAPTGALVTSGIKTDDAKLSAEATFTVRDSKTPGTTLVRTREFAVSGGGVPVRFTRRSGGRDPAGPHNLARSEVEIVEVILLHFRGLLGAAQDLGIPAPLESAGLFEDTDALRVPPWKRVEQGVTPFGDLWELRLTRVYRAASIAGLDSILLEAAADLDDRTSNVSAELARKLS
jgi:hypothetical protein